MENDETEGWFLDPFGRHEQRWFSAGTPTRLVRDGAVEGSDDPPAATFEGPLERPPEPPGSPDDLRRADAAETMSLADQLRGGPLGIPGMNLR